MKQQTPKKVEEIGGRAKAMLCAEVAAAHKAEKPLICEVGEVVGYTDYFVICSGRSTRHVQALAEHIEAALLERRIKPMGVEGLKEGHWVLLDLNDVIVHIFYHPMRAFYDLEGLWWEARQIEFSDTGGAD
jgi:ribosome-associated protein